MITSNKKYLYVNGTSVSAGGGFEEYSYRQDIRDEYLKKSIDLPDTQIECTYGYHIAKELNLQLINESKSGSGIDRLVRTTYEWILNNKDKVHDTIFILEAQSGIRLDWYVKEWNEYGVCNAAINEEGKYPFTLVKDWFLDDLEEQNKWNERFKESIDSWFDNFFDMEVHFKNEENKLLFFVSYLKLNNIDFIISIPHSVNRDNFIDSIGSDNVFSDCIWDYSSKNKMLISDEVNHTDGHIGYNGNIELSKLITEKIHGNNIF